MGRVSTHSLGVMCAVCETVLVPDNCSCGNAHGYGYQQPNEWAARTWPDHPCFLPPGGGIDWQNPIRHENGGVTYEPRTTGIHNDEPQEGSHEGERP